MSASDARSKNGSWSWIPSRSSAMDGAFITSDLVGLAQIVGSKPSMPPFCGYGK